MDFFTLNQHFEVVALWFFWHLIDNGFFLACSITFK